MTDVKFKIGDIVTTINGEGEPYKKYFGLLTKIENLEYREPEQRHPAECDIHDPRAYGYVFDIKWLADSVSYLPSSISGTFVRHWK